MPPYVPTRPDRGYVWITLLIFYGLGAWLIAKGSQFNSVGTKTIGALLVAREFIIQFQYCPVEIFRFFSNEAVFLSYIAE